MPATSRLPVVLPILAVFSFSACASARGQAIGFSPTISSFPNGVTFPVTPVVSYDRRYVRLTLAPQFNAIEGFDVAPVPGAVSGGPGGPGALGGGGLGGGLGGGGGNGGGRFAGMNGIQDENGVQMALSGNPGSSRPPMNFYASPDATALLSGFAGPIAPPRLSDGLPDEPPPNTRVRSKAKAKVRLRRTTKPATR